MHFKDKVVWITGASSGIGKELALQLDALGAILILTSSNQSLLSELQLQLQKSKILVYNLLDIKGIPGLVDEALSCYGRIDFVIQSAGISQRAQATETDMAVYEKLMAINYFAPVAINQALLPHFVAKNSGHSVIISSVAGLMGFPLRSGYAASKHAIKGYVETVQCELLETKVLHSIVYPGRIDTPISKNALQGNGQQYGTTDANNEVGMDVKICAQKIIKGIQKGKKAIVIVKAERILLWLWWFCPALYYKIAHKKGLQN
ncbi:SDR family NAD(P)-dependent oxidoreductase [Flavobacterium turcicum]|uniref:SDR family NAD(P)-dependent oxidoreductase n=1 Tax=Flavobacterium turcicum TaxID=2764718 RepID=A0ABR7JGK7_9FLAO|nr:SDR family NAD(P)-dependent oxidoreductase [Flavobacterium turcicum]MBC5863614.1 SDR family NAD(P)-dependent oxidoreductase [Flavobacterium turcicum]NHL02436.1 SDR family NAD(P)-dependent oxidoreductase [Flavobacterium turcicum]